MLVYNDAFCCVQPKQRTNWRHLQEDAHKLYINVKKNFHSILVCCNDTFTDVQFTSLPAKNI